MQTESIAEERDDCVSPERKFLGTADYGIIYIAVVAATLPAVLPVMVSVFANQMGFGAERAGFASSVNMGTILTGVLGCYLLVRYFSSRTLLLVGLAVMVGGHFLTMMSTDFVPIVLTRIFSGLGEGVVSGICYRAMGISAQPGRSVAIYTAGQAIVGALGMGSFTALTEAFGWQSLFVALSVIAIPAFWAANRYAARSILRPAVAAVGGGSLSPAVWVTLSGIFLTFTGAGGLFAFLAVIGQNHGLSAAMISAALAACSLAGLAGSCAAAAAAPRLPARWAMIAGASLLLAAVAALMLLPGAVGYTVGVVVLMFAWTWTFPFQFEILSRLDQQGRVLALTPAITGGGLAFGPLHAGIAMDAGYGVAGLVAGAAILASAVILLACDRHSRRSALSPHELHIKKS